MEVSWGGSRQRDALGRGRALGTAPEDMVVAMTHSPKAAPMSVHPSMHMERGPRVQSRIPSS